MNLQRFLRIAAIGVTCAIWVLSLIPLNQTAIPGGDKLHHLLAYALLMLIWHLATPSATPKQQAGIALLLTLMGLAIEAAQGLTAYRVFDLVDAVANSFGVTLGWLLSGFLLHRLPPEWLKSRS